MSFETSRSLLRNVQYITEKWTFLAVIVSWKMIRCIENHRNGDASFGWRIHELVNCNLSFLFIFLQNRSHFTQKPKCFHLKCASDLRLAPFETFINYECTQIELPAYSLEINFANLPSWIQHQRLQLYLLENSKGVRKAIKQSILKSASTK